MPSLIISIAMVGFKVGERRPVFNRKLEAIMLGSSDDDRLLSTLKGALMKSDFISIRHITEKEAQNDNPKR